MRCLTCQKTGAEPMELLLGFNTSLHLSTTLPTFLKVLFNCGLVLQIIGDDRICIRHTHRRKILGHLFGGVTLEKRGNEGLNRHACPPHQHNSMRRQGHRQDRWFKGKRHQQNPFQRIG